MDKVFYFSLIGMLSIGLYSVLDILQQYSEISESDVASLCRETVFYDLLFVVVCFVSSGLFFLYRFHQGYLLPILTTIVDFTYFFLSWRFCISYCSDPVRYLSQKTELWDSKEFENSKQSIMSEFGCCGINYNQSINKTYCSRNQVWPCSNAVALHKGRDLREKVWGQFTKSFMHLGTLLAIWVTEWTGGLEEDIYNDKNRNQSQYTQV